MRFVVQAQARAKSSGRVMDAAEAGTIAVEMATEYF
jgi:hypothetical protein